MTPSVDHPVIGYRTWYFDDGADAPLKSVIQNFHWTNGVNDAKCLRPLHWHRRPSPAPGCDCGLYAFHDLHRAKSYGGPRAVTGIVRGWGQLQVHQDGWRAEHAEVLAIVAADESTGTYSAKPELAARAAKHYGVPLLHPNSLPGLAMEFGKFVPEEIRPSTSVYAGSYGTKSGVEKAMDYLFILSPIVATWGTMAFGQWLYRRYRKSQ